jgi:2-polyprenyl-3-methyl-5-hydroxy-6-metoxy-1,4-benzoquinol methylase
MNIVDAEQLKNEVFCIKCELDAFADLATGRAPERWVEGFTATHVEQEHKQRYEFACSFANGRKVLDIACGTGQGSRMLAANGGASSVIAYDLSESAVRYAQIKNPHPNVAFSVKNGLHLNHHSEFDLAVCFETIEHIPTPELFLKRLADALRPNGVLLISTPISSLEIDNKPSNPHHLREWSCSSFRKLLSEDFLVTRVYIQYWPDYIPSLWKRLRSRIRRKLLSSRNGARVEPEVLNWKESDLDSFHSVPARLRRTAYQVLECSLKSTAPCQAMR